MTKLHQLLIATCVLATPLSCGFGKQHDSRNARGTATPTTKSATQNQGIANRHSNRVNRPHAVAPAKPKPKRLKGLIVVIDPGHGGRDPGTVKGTVRESDLTLAVAAKLKKLLEAEGAKVYRTRTRDEYVTLADRSAYSHKVGAHISVSLHINSMPNRKAAEGIETYYFRGLSNTLAHTVHAVLVSQTQAVDRKVRSNRRFYLISAPRVPSVLVELGFITSIAEKGKLKSPKYQHRLAAGIRDGLIRWRKKSVRSSSPASAKPAPLTHSKRKDW